MSRITHRTKNKKKWRKLFFTIKY